MSAPGAATLSSIEEAAARLARSARLSSALLVFVSLPTFFWGIGTIEVSDIVEERVAVTSREMWRSGDWVIPRMNGEVRLQKPPLAYWLPAAVSKIRGRFDDVSLRLPFALAALACVLFTWGAGRMLFGPETGLAAGLVLLTTALLERGGHTASADVLLTACVAAAWFFHARARRLDMPGTGSIPIWLSLGVGFLAKGPVVLVPTMLPWFLEAAVSRSRAPLRPLAGVAGPLLFLVVAFSWFGLVAFRLSTDVDTQGLPYLRQWFLETIGKMTPSEGIEEGYRYLKHPNPWHFYILRIPAIYTFWTPFVLLGLVVSTKRCIEARGRGAPPEAQPLSWFLTTFLFVSAITEKKITYVLPLAPAGALLGARAIEVCQAAMKPVVRAVLALAALLAALVAVVAVAAAVRPDVLDRLPVLSSDMEIRGIVESGAGSIALLAAVVLVGCGAAQVLAGCSRPLPWVVALACAVSLAMIPYQDLSREAKRGEWVGEDSRRLGLWLRSDATILAVGRLPAGTLYYLDRRLTPVAIEDAWVRAAQAPSGTGLLVPASTVREIAKWPAGFDTLGALPSLFSGYRLRTIINPATRRERERVYYLERVPD